MMHGNGSRRAVCWNSLPYDVVSRIADRFLATNDVDYYMDLRAVCRDWRSATDDPKSTNTPWGWDDMRFWPRRWIVLHVEFNDAGLLLNTATGRFLLRDTGMASVLRTHRVAAAAAGGLLVLVDRMKSRRTGRTCGVRVLNPLTGHSVRFRASVPTHIRIDNVVAVLGHPSPPTLVLCSGSGNLFRADPDSKHFVMYTAVSKDSLLREAVANGVYSDLTMKLLPFARDHPVIMTTTASAASRRYSRFMVESAGETLAIVMRQNRRVEVFSCVNTDEENNTTPLVIGPMKSIGGRAIFVGASRCLSVDADKFPGVDGDCIYYVVDESVEEDWGQGVQHICMYDMKKEKEERVIGAALVTDRRPPFTIVQLLSGYTHDIHILTLLSDIDDYETMVE